MQRYLVLFALFLLSLPVGLSITGCQTNVSAYCNGLGYGIKTDAVSAIDLEPKTTGISLSWGQTSQLAAPTATTCKGATATVSAYKYGSSNLLLADVSPTGAICGGTWNRNSPGGIADYTICTPPAGSTSEQCSSTSCGVVNFTASGAGVTSNVVNVYVHPPVTAITIPTPGACISQNNTAAPLTTGTVVSGPNGVAIPDGSTNADGSVNPNYVGTITYTPVDGNIVEINNTSASGTGINGSATAKLPGSTVVNATVSQVSSAAGYFYTCPPASISLSLNGNRTGGQVIQGSPQNLTVSAQDTAPTPVLLNGLTLDYTSTQPQEIAVSSAGAVSTTYPSTSTVNAICQPSTCNEAPVSQIGVYGTGMPVTSNNLTITSPGRSSNYLWMASTQSQFFSSVDLTTGTPGSPVKLPYPPNSMVLDQTGTNLYFGSYRELMVYTATTNALTKEDTNVPGVVLAVSPDGTQVIIDDQLRSVIYLYTTSTSTTTSSTYTSIGGTATRAKFSPDGKNVYIVGEDPVKKTNMLYVHNASTGWSTYPLGALEPAEQACTLNNNSPLATSTGTYDPFCGADVAITVPSVFPFFSGSQTTARSFCPNTTTGEQFPYYPQVLNLGAASGADTQHLTTTFDGKHVIGANEATLSDIWLYADANQTTAGIAPGPCPAITADVTTANPHNLTTSLSQTPLTGITPTEINSVVASPDSTVAFITYTAAAGTGLLPAYQPSATNGALGTLTNVQLSGAAQSPLAGVFSPDESIFFVSTSGDNLVHFVTPSTLTDSKTINPGLTDSTGNAVPVQMMAVFPRPTT
ncbi:hypothetical protein [Silvibacterium acidisoli]|uniref:hypothetical protein n=1 Tax=Acidobacteriaceae bacterium ZG23-2 TaxID=2883246 RepID=UPI00406C8993